jgi:hypothetical protein
MYVRVGRPRSWFARARKFLCRRVNQRTSIKVSAPRQAGFLSSLSSSLWAEAPKARDVTSGEATSREPQNGHDAGEQARLQRLQEERDALEEEVLKLRSRRTIICSLM